jgi:hypothetical protein
MLNLHMSLTPLGGTLSMGSRFRGNDGSYFALNPSTFIALVKLTALSA